MQTCEQGGVKAGILAAVKLPISEKWVLKRRLFGDFAQRKCPVFTTT
jgi:hypothetical protein